MLAYALRYLYGDYRIFQRILIRKVKGFTSTGHVLVVAAYIAINAIIMFTDVDWSLPSNIARRFGWYVDFSWLVLGISCFDTGFLRLATANIAFIFFLALKNTPLGFLTSYSYERLNVLHQIAGYTTVLLSVLHSMCVINVLDILPNH